MFTLDLLQAINDWQAGGFDNRKKELAERLSETSRDLPSTFKIMDKPCLRRIDLLGKFILQIGINLELPETYSSWTFDEIVAQGFYEGVPPKNYTGVIFKLTPDNNNYDVILNLDLLYSDKNFLEFIEINKHNIANYNEGIGRFSNSEKEIILKVDTLRIEQIWAYGGYRSSPEKLAEMYFGRKPNPDEIVAFNRIIEHVGKTLWVKGDAKNRLINENIENAKKINELYWPKI